MPVLAIAASQIFTPLEVIPDGLLLVEDGLIRAVGPRNGISVPPGARLIELGNRVLAPGFVDVHIHGAAGHDVMEGTPAALEAVASLLLKHGTTCFVPTTVSAPEAVLLQSVAGLASAIRSWKTATRSGAPLAEPVGIHLEGPFLSPECRGVHPREHLQKPSLPLFERLWEASQDFLRILTLAPELEGALDLEAAALRHGVRVALGHSNASYEQAQRAIDAGATQAVHVFNAMRPFAHRDPGILGAVLTDDRVVAEVIADGVHVAGPALELLLRAKGSSGIALVTDGVSATGQGPGPCRLGSFEIQVERDPQTGELVCRNAEGKLAGSVLTQDRAVRNMVRFTGVTLCDAVRMASWNPARLLGLDERKGCLRPGSDADLVVLEPNGTVAGAMARGVGNFL